jgi:hypothetical protein
MFADPVGRALVAAIHERKQGADMTDRLAQIQARDIEDMEDLIDGGIMRTLSGKRIARILSDKGFGRTSALLAMVRERDAALERVAKVALSLHDPRVIQHSFHIGSDPEHDAYKAQVAARIRAAITATEGAE